MNATAEQSEPAACSLGGRLRFLLFLLLLLTDLGAEPTAWSLLPKLPNTEGLAGAIAGRCGSGLLVAGGTNFPAGRPWEGGQKTWHDEIYVLDSPDGQWRTAGRLPHPLAYAAAIAFGDCLIVAGGNGPDRVYDEVLALTLAGDSVAIRRLPRLPKPCAYAAFAATAKYLYLLGGQSAPDAPPLHTVWRMKLKRPDDGWVALPPWPGPERMFAVAGADKEEIFLFSGYRLVVAGNAASREFLRDAYAYTETGAWRRLPDSPRPFVATPGPLPLAGHSLLFLGWNDGSLASRNPANNSRYFPTETFLYDVARNQWNRGPSLPFSNKTTTTVTWEGSLVVPTGEVRPGIRSPDIWKLPLELLNGSLEVNWYN